MHENPRGALAVGLPTHVEADVLVLSGLARLVRGGSIVDFGAGVGQYGHDPQLSKVRWRGYDGAGDVEEYTNGFVRFVDLTIPLALPRADWVVSLEVAEHVPREHELMLVRNLHAHNCLGIVLSWACYGGHQHVNKRDNAYVIGTFERLGYRYDELSSYQMRKPSQRARLSKNYSHRVYGWFARSVMVFRRITPLVCE